MAVNSVNHNGRIHQTARLGGFRSRRRLATKWIWCSKNSFQALFPPSAQFHSVDQVHQVHHGDQVCAPLSSQDLEVELLPFFFGSALSHMESAGQLTWTGERKRVRWCVLLSMVWYHGAFVETRMTCPASLPSSITTSLLLLYSSNVCTCLLLLVMRAQRQP